MRRGLPATWDPAAAFDAAIAEFAMAYAAQIERDWREFVEAIKSGTIEARRRMIPDLTAGRSRGAAERVPCAALKLATAESCTGGLIAAVLTAIAGSSDVVDCGFVTYSNEAKSELLGVPPELIRAVGVVSGPVVQAWRKARCSARVPTIAVSVTGIAGPGGGSAEKPVGLVWFGLAQQQKPVTAAHQVFPGDRTAIRLAAVQHALALINALL